MSSFHGGTGDFQASIWLSAGDVNAAPVSFASVSSSIQVSILASDGVSKVVLVPSSDSPKQFGTRQWVHFTTPGATAFPRGGWLTVAVTDFKLTLQVAAPEVTSSILGAKSRRPVAGRTLQSDDDRRALTQARLVDQSPPDLPGADPLDDR
jgi:hypothetical protein